MRVLVLLEDAWHPAEVPRAGLQGLCKFGFEFDWIDEIDERSAERMVEYPIVILCKADYVSPVDETRWMTGQVQTAFEKHVNDGGGLLVLHAGAAVDQGAAVMRRLIGGYFVGHPEQSPVRVEPRDSHYLTAGCGPFTETDEHYFMCLDDEDLDIFLTTSSEHGTQPAGWVRTSGQGRVCVMTPGHNPDIWLHPAYQQLLLSALRSLQ